MKIKNEVHSQADALLAEIARIQGQIAKQEALAQAAMDQVLAAFKARETDLRERLKAKDKELKAFGKKNLAALFDNQDKVDLPHGALLLQQTNKVVRKRTVTPSILEQHGFSSAVKVAKSVDWDQVETWPAEKLILIGTERKAKTTINYDLAKDKNGKEEPKAKR